MCDISTIHGMRLFLFGVLRLIKRQHFESTVDIEREISTGVATYLYEKYTSDFVDIGFNKSNLSAVDTYYMDWNGCADGKEGKYDCNQNDGLYLLLALTLNHLF